MSAFLVVGPDAPPVACGSGIRASTRAAISLFLRSGDPPAVRVTLVGRRGRRGSRAVLRCCTTRGSCSFGPAPRSPDPVAPPAGATSPLADRSGASPVVLVAWVPFLLFEAAPWLVRLHARSRNSAEARQTLIEKIYRAGQGDSVRGHPSRARGLHSRVHLTPLIAAGTLGAFWFALRRRSTDAAVVVPAVVLAAGLAAQVATNEGRRTDVLHALASRPLRPLRLDGGTTLRDRRPDAMRAAACPDAHRWRSRAGAVIAVLAVGGLDLHRAITGTPTEKHTRLPARRGEGSLPGPLQG